MSLPEASSTANENSLSGIGSVTVGTPVASTDRLVTIDVLRGFAVLGILAMNIVSIGMPGATRLNPLIWGGFEGLDLALWWAGYLLFDEKMITLFSMLFGAGLVLQADRATRTGRSPARVFYRRAVILLGIGLIHAYLLWDGDILVTYAMCGMIVYPARKLSPPKLILAGLLMMTPSIPFGLAISSVFANARNAAERVETLKESEAPIPAELKAAAAPWAEINRGFHPTVEQVKELIAQERALPYLQHIQAKASEAFSVQTQLFLAAFLWLVGGRMLIGMGLMKLGVLSGERAAGFSRNLAIAGYSLGLPLVWRTGKYLILRDFDPEVIFGGGLLANSFASLFVTMGHVGLVSWVVSKGLLSPLTQRLAAVGRMSLTNYLSQSLICTALFCGWGVGLLGRFNRTSFYGVMLLIWITQLSLSPIWLKFFKFGPAEWVWRSLNYGKPQPMRVSNSEFDSR